ncbi:hypothetical protein [Sphingobium sp. OAS761]|uniref:hypothetical protein n=1 Tax=Sphingobium sp. OAS761 TaxID=2817901 RepID=UPI00209EF069|nr:hypothetical protein [Sphingobium sp. OAS761]
MIADILSDGIGPFNTREVATGIWLAAFLGWCLFQPGVRSSLGQVIKAACHPVLLGPVALLAVYIALVTWALAQAGLWETSLLKTTILWSVTSAIALLGRTITAKEKPGFFRELLTDNLKITAAVEFVAVFYTFHLLAELVLIPLITLLSLTAAFAEGKPENRQVHSLLNGILSVFGFGLLGYSIHSIYTAPDTFATWQTFEEFYLPPLLSIGLIPFLFVMKAYASYEQEFVRIGFAIKDERLRRTAKRRAVMSFGLDLGGLRRWITHIQQHPVSSKADLIQTIGLIKMLQRREQKPPTVSADQGWSPYLAKDFLSAAGLATGDYHPLCDEWFASSPYLELGEGLWKDNIAYYAEGTEHAATVLKLILHVNDMDTAPTSEARFLEVIQTLYQHAFEAPMAEPLLRQLRNEGNFTRVIGGKRLTLSRDDNEGGSRRGYRRKFTIEHLAAVGNS